MSIKKTLEMCLENKLKKHELWTREKVVLYDKTVYHDSGKRNIHFNKMTVVPMILPN